MSLSPQLEAVRKRRMAERAVTPARRRAVTPAVTESVSVRPLPSQSRTDLLVEETSWGWEELRDYVVAQIEARWGAFPRDARKEAAIFKRWHGKYGADAPAIARYAFENCEGLWKGAPISVNRFCANSDQWFSEPILEALRDTN